MMDSMAQNLRSSRYWTTRSRQRLFRLLQLTHRFSTLDAELDEVSGASLEMLQRLPEPIGNNPNIPIETFHGADQHEPHFTSSAFFLAYSRNLAPEKSV
jgi:hypothetical protein